MIINDPHGAFLHTMDTTKHGFHTLGKMRVTLIGNYGSYEETFEGYILHWTRTDEGPAVILLIPSTSVIKLIELDCGNHHSRMEAL